MPYAGYKLLTRDCRHLNPRCLQMSPCSQQSPAAFNISARSTTLNTEKWYSQPALTAVVTRVSTNGEKRKTALKLFRWVRNLSSTFSQSEIFYYQQHSQKLSCLQMRPPEESKRTFSSQEPSAGKSGNFISKSQPFMLGWRVFFPVSTFVFSVISTFTHDMQTLVSYSYTKMLGPHQSIFNCS